MCNRKLASGRGCGGWPGTLPASLFFACMLAIAPVAARPLVVNIEESACRAVPEGDPALSLCAAVPAEIQPTRVTRKGGQCRFVDQRGRPLVQRWFDRCGDQYVRGRALICAPASDNPQGCGLINENGQVIVPPIYEQVRLNPDSDLIALSLNGKWGFFDAARRELVLAPQFESVTDYRDGLAWGREGADQSKGGGWILARDGTRQAAVPAGVDKLGLFSGGFVAARIKGLWGFLGADGRWAIAPEFHAVTNFDQGFAMVQAASDPEQWALIDQQGRGRIFWEGQSHGLASFRYPGVLIRPHCTRARLPGGEATHFECDRMCFKLEKEPVETSPFDTAGSPMKASCTMQAGP